LFKREAQVFWFTGLSGSGKTTIVTETIDRLSDDGKAIRVLDGDDVRSRITAHLGFTPDDIKENNRIIAEMCKEMRSDYDYIFVPIISPFEESRDKARELIGNGFFLIYVKASLDEVIRRDVKGLYKKAVRGEIENFIGLAKDVPFQEPQHPDLILDSEKEEVKDSVSQLVSFIRSLND
jgi:adenylylsulfate kinase